MQQAGADSARRVQQQAACPAACIALAAGADWDKRRTAHQMGPAHHGTILVAWVQGPTGRTAQPQHVFTLQIDARLADKAARRRDTCVFGQARHIVLIVAVHATGRAPSWVHPVSRLWPKWPGCPSRFKGWASWCSELRPWRQGVNSQKTALQGAAFNTSTTQAAPALTFKRQACKSGSV